MRLHEVDALCIWCFAASGMLMGLITVSPTTRSVGNNRYP
jgi:hypothetical protein